MCARYTDRIFSDALDIKSLALTNPEPAVPDDFEGFCADTGCPIDRVTPASFEPASFLFSAHMIEAATDLMHSTLQKHPFSDRDWLFEWKLDGFRCLVRKQGPSVDLRSGNL